MALMLHMSHQEALCWPTSAPSTRPVPFFNRKPKTETAPDDEDAFEYENCRNPDHTY
jgi:hypothetical protein